MVYVECPTCFIPMPADALDAHLGWHRRIEQAIGLTLTPPRTTWDPVLSAPPPQRRPPTPPPVPDAPTPDAPDDAGTLTTTPPPERP